MTKSRFLFWLSNELREFRLTELNAVCCTLGFLQNDWGDTQVCAKFPFVIREFENCESAVTLARRTVAVRAVYELIADASSVCALHSNVRDVMEEEPSVISRHCQPCKSYRLSVDTFNRKLSLTEKISLIDEFQYLSFEGPVSLEDPQVSFHIIQQFRHGGCGAPHHVFFGRWLSAGARSLVTRHSLKSRIYIGNTSMDPELALVMANLAHVRSGSLVLDPFSGTGSTLVAAAQMGAYVLGSDLDYQTVHARTRPSRVQRRGAPRGPEESIAANFGQYSLQSRLLDVAVADASLLTRLWRPELRLDAIVTDPPYGIREANQRLGSRQEQLVPEQYRHCRVPSKVSYCAGQLYTDLLQLAAERLRVGGRLVFWVPILREDYSPEHLPSHPCLQLMSNCEQPLTRHSSRRLLALQKCREPCAGDVPLVHPTTGAFTQRYFQSDRSTGC